METVRHDMTNFIFDLRHIVILKKKHILEPDKMPRNRTPVENRNWLTIVLNDPCEAIPRKAILIRVVVLFRKSRVRGIV